MLRCLCPSPAVDVTYHVARFAVGGSNRVASVTRRAGGKAVNVARVAHAAGGDAMLIAAVGGMTGTEFVADLRAEGIEHRLIEGAPATRSTLTVVEDGGASTVLNEPASVGDTWPGVVALLADLMHGGDVLVVSGSLPSDLDPTAMTDLVASARALGSPVVVDTSGPALRAALVAGPVLVKPNHEELCDVTGEADAQVAAAALSRRYGTVVVASLGPDGVLAATPDRLWAARPPERLTGNPTGAGDALVAGLALALASPDRSGAAPTGSGPAASVGSAARWLPGALRAGVALSAAAVRMPHAGAVDHRYAEEIRDQVVVEELAAAR